MTVEIPQREGQDPHDAFREWLAREVDWNKVVEKYEAAGLEMPIEWRPIIWAHKELKARGEIA